MGVWGLVVSELIGSLLLGRSEGTQLRLLCAAEKAKAGAAVSDFQSAMLEWDAAALSDLAEGQRRRLVGRQSEVRLLRERLQEARRATAELGIVKAGLSRP